MCPTPFTVSPLDYPALDGRPVTQAHTDYCAARGHATYIVAGRDTGTCPRCGEAPRATLAMEARAEAAKHGARALLAGEAGDYRTMAAADTAARYANRRAAQLWQPPASPVPTCAADDCTEAPVGDQGSADDNPAYCDDHNAAWWDDFLSGAWDRQPDLAGLM